MDSDSELRLLSLISQLLSPSNTDSDAISNMIQIISMVSSLDLNTQPKPQSKLMSLITETISLFNSMNLDSQPEPLRKLVSLSIQKVSHLNSVGSDYEPKPDPEFMYMFYETFNLEPMPKLISTIDQIYSLFILPDPEPKPKPEMDPEQESKFISLLSQIYSIFAIKTNAELELRGGPEELPKFKSFISLTKQLMSLISSLDLETEPEPESEFISVVSCIKQIISFAHSISNSEPDFISSTTEMFRLISSIDLEEEPPMKLAALFQHTLSLLYSMDRDSELIILIGKIISVIDRTDSEPEAEWGLEQLISLSPQTKVKLVQGKFHVTGKIERTSKEKGRCQPKNKHRLYLESGEDASHFLCKDCNGEDHVECEKTPVEVKHLLHPKHSLQLVLQKSSITQTRKCFCCDEDLKLIFYYCTVCDYAMNIACAEKPPVLFIDHPKWHADTLALFPRQAFLTCNVCAVADSSSPIYMCPPCDFVVHLKCISLPRVIRISRHQHRISFTTSFDEGDWSCGVCRKTIDNDYGGYSCIKDGCSYAAHSRCATQKNVWDGIYLEGVPEEIEEEEVEPFVTISKGVIHHFSHQNHHLRLDENEGRVYDENKICQACIMPIYFGNFFSCMQCDYILQ
ncbi:Cysteine/Histidine-rich C1 domain family protein [Arabidopsis thaliana]|uniref:Cysteine/Histidine-rich C1 domain family protein n=2 Tax=Arabidopsis thaliana TaxID=3702 RepID=A0A1P8AMN4_ARATH|nr:Cysteine/Histidine-rich C1 domain family protein [Arabidopsis thaliana]ANM57921.1 Cysteine/Histidine-rich C1 domain family protein [Arabidopsis thaliana]|eukprot:NP_001320396.1 Cysteine/Histidine-rich C1 domain family protein [Arabidopsis thaliana]